MFKQILQATKFAQNLHVSLIVSSSIAYKYFITPVSKTLVGNRIERLKS